MKWWHRHFLSLEFWRRHTSSPTLIMRAGIRPCSPAAATLPCLTLNRLRYRFCLKWNSGRRAMIEGISHIWKSQEWLVFLNVAFRCTFLSMFESSLVQSPWRSNNLALCGASVMDCTHGLGLAVTAGQSYLTYFFKSKAPLILRCTILC